MHTFSQKLRADTLAAFGNTGQTQKAARLVLVLPVKSNFTAFPAYANLLPSLWLKNL
jgi:hypothetical protein